MEILPNREIVVQGKALGHIPDAGSDLFGLAKRVVSQDGGPARCRTQQPEQHAHGCGLTRAIRTQVPDDLALTNVKTYVIHGHEFPEMASQVTDLDDRLYSLPCSER